MTEPTTRPWIPLPRPQHGEVAVAPPEPGPGSWAGAPSAVGTDTGVVLAYRLRRPVGHGRGYAVVIAHAADGVHFDPVVTLPRDAFGGDSLERPALVRRADGGWRVYISVATPGTKHWRVDALDADELADLDPEQAVTVLAGDAHTALKDPVVVRDGDIWRMWVCRHPLDVVGAEDRMATDYATSADGLEWTFHGEALGPRAGAWDARGTRVTSVLHTDGVWVAYYDGRADALQNWEEQTGIARGDRPDRLDQVGDAPAAVSPHGMGGLRYVSVVEDPGGCRLYYELTGDGGGHDLRTEYVPRPRSDTQSENESPVTRSSRAMSSSK